MTGTAAAILSRARNATSYKTALLRAINDGVLAFPGSGSTGRAVAAPLRLLPARWVANDILCVIPRCRCSKATARNGVSFGARTRP